MYIPAVFEQTDISLLHDFIEAHSFAMLVTATAGSHMVGSHLPLLLDRNVSSHGTLLGHIARANSQWREATGEALAIFTGPHAYISPRWYQANAVVPTWNYVAVHVYGPLEWITDRDELIELLARTIDQYESGEDDAWTLARSGSAVEQLLGAIVGFRLQITRLQGKWKLSQNHPRERREKIIAALSAQTDPDSQSIAALMREDLTRD